MSRKMALDVGDKTIGVAVSDELCMIAQGLTTLARVGIRKDTGIVLDLVRDYGCDTVVLGLPLNMNGSKGPQALSVEELGTMLANKLRSSGLSDVRVLYEDERLTTAMAEKILISGDVRRNDRKKVIDKQAAVLILQSYLEKYASGRG